MSCYNGPMRRCPNNETGYLSLQINIICLLLALIGATIITKHPKWFGGLPAERGIKTPYSR
jgi:hypothetical protein